MSSAKLQPFCLGLNVLIGGFMMGNWGIRYTWQTACVDRWAVYNFLSYCEYHPYKPTKSHLVHTWSEAGISGSRSHPSRLLCLATHTMSPLCWFLLFSVAVVHGTDDVNCTAGEYPHDQWVMTQNDPFINSTVTLQGSLRATLKKFIDFSMTFQDHNLKFPW